MRPLHVLSSPFDAGCEPPLEPCVHLGMEPAQFAENGSSRLHTIPSPFLGCAWRFAFSLPLSSSLSGGISPSYLHASFVIPPALARISPYARGGLPSCTSSPELVLDTAHPFRPLSVARVRACSVVAAAVIITIMYSVCIVRGVD